MTHDESIRKFLLEQLHVRPDLSREDFEKEYAAKLGVNVDRIKKLMYENKCGHFGPSASDEAREKCPLCRDLRKYGMPASSAAIKVLNTMPKKEEKRVCDRCSKSVKQLVSREKIHICEECAKELDDE